MSDKNIRIQKWRVDLVIEVYMFRGTGNKLGEDLSYSVTDKLDKTKYNVVEIEYPATIGPVGGQVDGESLEDNLLIALELFGQARNKSRHKKYALIGFSLGALCATKILEVIEKNIQENGPTLGIDYGPEFAVLIANPARNPGDSALGLAGNVKYGVYGKHEPFPKHTHVIELASGRDMITAVDPKSPIRLISKLFSPFEIIAGQPSPDYNLLELLNEVRREDWLSWLHPGRYVEALNDIGGYILPWGRPSRTQHTMYNLEVMPLTNQTWTDWAVTQLTQKFG